MWVSLSAWAVAFPKTRGLSENSGAQTNPERKKDCRSFNHGFTRIDTDKKERHEFSRIDTNRKQPFNRKEHAKLEIRNPKLEIRKRGKRRPKNFFAACEQFGLLQYKDLRAAEPALPR
jgi:hypothetical protein